MRNQWVRLLLLRRQTPSRPCISQVLHLRSFTSTFHPRAPHVSPNSFSSSRLFTSTPELDNEPPKPPSDQAVLVADIFANHGRSNDEIKLTLDHKNVLITHDLILGILGDNDTDPFVAKRIFDWVLENQNDKLSSESFNLMLGILGSNGLVKETWGTIGIMKEKGYSVSEDTFFKISERFQKNGFNDDVEKLKELCDLDSLICMKDDASEENVEFYDSCSVSCVQNDASGENALEDDGRRVSDMINREVWGGDLEKQLQELDVEFSSDLVTRVLKNLKMDPNKALILFRWIEECGVFKNDQQSYNAMARVLSEEDHSKKFWRIVNEMRSEGHEMEKETYVHISKQFVKKNMVNDAVDLYEFALNGGIKPSDEDCILLLNKIVSNEVLDMDLFSRVVLASKPNENASTDAIVDAVIKSLISVGRMDEGNRILVAMKEAGFALSGPSRCKIAFELSGGGKTELALDFMDTMVPSLDYLCWESLVKGFCAYGNLDEASKGLRRIVELVSASYSLHALEVLISTYCQKNVPFDGYKLVSEMVKGKGLNPSYATYKKLTKGLLTLNHFKEALDVMSMIKNQGHPPYLYPFVEYLSKAGSAEDAIEFTRAVTSKRYPATNVFLLLFEGYITAGRLSEAQYFLSKCPKHIKNHADVLNLFSSTKSGEIVNEDVAV